ncbi:MAG: tungstate ABC transporter substrate-binding protein WtpA [Desulfovibrionaceae bacterium]
MSKLLFFALTALALAMPLSASAGELSGKLSIFHAGSLSVPLETMEKAFEAAHPGVDVQRESGGSTKMARMISELGKPADIMASADYVVIDKNLIPKNTDINIRFATNQMVLCYTDKSKFASEITSANWPEILQRKGVEWGHSDPNLDPCGYRSLMVLQLAGIYRNDPGLYQALLANRPEKNVRPKSVELIALLESGNMDYAWEYLSVAVQHGLKYVTLDPHINLSDYAYDAFYAQAKVDVSGDKPGATITRVGGSITYGVTLLRDAPNKPAAVAFLAYLLSPDGGLKILDEMGQPPFIPARVPTQAMYDALPDELKPLVKVAD